MKETAYNSVQSSYDIDTLKDIVEHGCSSGVAHDHIYYSETLSFFDNYEDEIIEIIAEDKKATEETYKFLYWWAR